MARVHPLQNLYFNFLVDRTTPERLRTQYEMDYWKTARFGALHHLALTYSTSLCLAREGHERQLLSEAQRKRTSHCLGRRVDFTVDARAPLRKYFVPKVWVRKVYDNTIVSVYSLNPGAFDDSHVDLHLDRFRETHRSLTQGAPAARAHYDMYFDTARGALTYARAPCVDADLRARFFLHVVPVDADDLPDHRVRYGFDDLDFDPREQALFDGKCLVTVRLPEYAVDHIRTGQFNSAEQLWNETITPGRAMTRAGSRRRSSATGDPRRR